MTSGVLFLRLQRTASSLEGIAAGPENFPTAAVQTIVCIAAADFMTLAQPVDPLDDALDERRAGVRPRTPYLASTCTAAISVLAAALAIAMPAQGAPSSQHTSSVVSSTRNVILDCTNRERAKSGLPALRQSRTLRRAAQYHAGNMLRYRFFAHNDTAGRNAAERVAMFKKHHGFHYIGENIAAGYRTGSGACRSWVVSAKHRHNILDPDYKWIGIGFASGDGGHGSYFVQNFGG